MNMAWTYSQSKLMALNIPHLFRKCQGAFSSIQWTRNNEELFSTTYFFKYLFFFFLNTIYSCNYHKVQHTHIKQAVEKETHVVWINRQEVQFFDAFVSISLSQWYLHELSFSLHQRYNNKNIAAVNLHALLSLFFQQFFMKYSYIFAEYKTDVILQWQSSVF